MSDIDTELQSEEKFLIAGTKIAFEGATESNFGIITVVDGVLDIVYFDGTTAHVRMGKFPVISAIVISDARVIIGRTDLDVSINDLQVKSRSKHTKWYERSGWN